MINEHVKKSLITFIKNKVNSCNNCEFLSNGKIVPFFGIDSKYMIIGEAPHIKEIELRSPFVGESGQLLWKIIDEVIQLKRDDFIIFNSVMCKPTVPIGKTTGKPTKIHIDGCIVNRTDLLTFLYDYFNVKNILVLGNYARYIFTGNLNGIESVNGKTIKTNFCNRLFDITYCLHPSSCLHNPSKKDKFVYGIRKFGEAIWDED